MWDSNPRGFLHYELGQELVLVRSLTPNLVPGEESYSEPQRNPVTTWVILHSCISLDSMRANSTIWNPVSKRWNYLS